MNRIVTIFLGAVFGLAVLTGSAASTKLPANYTIVTTCGMVADIVAVLGGLNVVAGELER